MHLNEFGEIAHVEWLRSEEVRESVRLDEFVIMPDHIHGIILLME
jgi:REP element-mobilizing transposase RayT